MINKIIAKIFKKSIIPEIDQWMPTPSGEKEIRWLDDPRKYYFVRTRIFYSKRRDTGPGDCTSGRVIGYSVLGPDQKQGVRGFYIRRYFYLTKMDLRQDCVYYREKCHPGEGVTPTTVKPGIWGKHIQPKTSERLGAKWQLS